MQGLIAHRAASAGEAGLREARKTWRRLPFTVPYMIFLAAFPGSEVGAESRSVKDCVKFSANTTPPPTPLLGWLENTCDVPVGVVHDFDINPDGTPRQDAWCSGRVSHQAYLQDAHILNPGESVGVGWAFQGRPKNVFFAVCTVDTSKNNAVFITLEEPAFHFLPNCDYECE